jgi:hypothetical protein
MNFYMFLFDHQNKTQDTVIKVSPVSAAYLVEFEDKWKLWKLLNYP